MFFLQITVIVQITILTTPKMYACVRAVVISDKKHCRIEPTYSYSAETKNLILTAPMKFLGWHQSGLAPKGSCKPSKGLELEHGLKGPLCPWYFANGSLIVLSKSWVSLNWNVKRYPAQTLPSQSEALFVGHVQMPLVWKELRSTVHLAINKSLSHWLRVSRVWPGMTFLQARPACFETFEIRL